MIYRENGTPHISKKQRLVNLDDKDKLRDLISSLALSTGRYEETQLTTEQKELLYDTVEHCHPDIYKDRKASQRWWRL